MTTENDQSTAPVQRIVMRCDLCRWWKHTEISEGVLQKCHPDDRDGECYRYPPVLYNTGPLYNWARPVTFGDDFCGEFVSAQRRHSPGLRRKT